MRPFDHKSISKYLNNIMQEYTETSIPDSQKIDDSEELEDKVLEFLSNNPNPDDAKVHAWAQKNSLNVHKLESVFYKLATKYALFAKGGRFNKSSDEKDIDPKELAVGMDIEKEHTPDAEMAKRIAKDHLSEIKDYYTRLRKMEKEAGTTS